jgi:hypothetical protein
LIEFDDDRPRARLASEEGCARIWIEESNYSGPAGSCGGLMKKAEEFRVPDCRRKDFCRRLYANPGLRHVADTRFNAALERITFEECKSMIMRTARGRE